MRVTPVILTYNEGVNIHSTLSSLAWVPRIIVLDSGSTDETERIARSFDNVEWFERAFDSHRAQWLYAIQETAIATDYVLALDADMRPAPGFREELGAFLERKDFAGAWIPFEYRMLGRGLMSSIYPTQIRLFRKDRVRIKQTGHSQVFEVDGPVSRFRSQLIHEDLKPMNRWLSNQVNYASLEAARIRQMPKKSFKDRLRMLGISPAIWGAYAYMKAGGPLRRGAAGAYAYERLIFEAILARMLAQNDQQPADPAAVVADTDPANRFIS
jgi:glycosyltransferase involved in cell wall biosynthesis